MAGEVGRPLVEVVGRLVGVDRVRYSVWLEHCLEGFDVEVVGDVFTEALNLLLRHLREDVFLEVNDEAEGFVLSVVGDWRVIHGVCLSVLGGHNLHVCLTFFQLGSICCWLHVKRSVFVGILAGRVSSGFIGVESHLGQSSGEVLDGALDGEAGGGGADFVHGAVCLCLFDVPNIELFFHSPKKNETFLQEKAPRRFGGLHQITLMHLFLLKE